jgi:hypothetical protein
MQPVKCTKGLVGSKIEVSKAEGVDAGFEKHGVECGCRTLKATFLVQKLVLMRECCVLDPMGHRQFQMSISWLGSLLQYS